jgi:hypothetical protein
MTGAQASLPVCLRFAGVIAGIAFRKGLLGELSLAGHNRF